MERAKPDNRRQADLVAIAEALLLRQACRRSHT